MKAPHLPRIDSVLPHTHLRYLHYVNRYPLPQISYAVRSTFHLEPSADPAVLGRTAPSLHPASNATCNVRDRLYAFELPL